MRARAARGRRRARHEDEREEEKRKAKEEKGRRKREEEERRRKGSQPKTKRKPFNFEQVRFERPTLSDDNVADHWLRACRRSPKFLPQSRTLPKPLVIWSTP